MFLHYRTQGLVLKKEAQEEADQLFTIYTKDFGKLEVLGKGIRKISSKLRAGIDIFYFSEIEFIQGKTHKTLTDAIKIEKFKNLRNNLKKLAIAYKISEVLDNLVSGQEPDEKIWKLLSESFEKLNTLHLTSFTLHLVYYYFFWNLLSLLGYQPQFYNCALCQKKLKPEKLYFNPKEGGVICHNCLKKVKIKLKSTQEIDLEAIKILRIILEKNWKILSKLKIKKDHLSSLNLISEEWHNFIKNNP